MTLLAIVIAWALGGAAVALLWPRERTLRTDLPIIVPLGALVGLFASSVLFFVASLFVARPALVSAAFELVGLTMLLWQANRRWRREMPLPTRPFTLPEWALAAGLFQVAVVAAMVAWRSFVAEPLGGWDGWAIWNMHARFMLRAGTQWPDLLAASQLNWTHPDYPRLIPACVARVWAWAGREDPSASALISVLFAAATAALLVGALSQLRSRAVACVSGILLLATPFFVTFAANQHADIPLGSLMLGAVVLVVIGGRHAPGNGAWCLAGICAGGAAWTKNEGLLFAGVLTTAVVIYSARIKTPVVARRFVGVLAVALIPVLYFKLHLAPANDLMSGPIGGRFEQLWDGARHQTIVLSIWRDLGRFGEWNIVPWVFLGLPLLAWRVRPKFSVGEWIVPVVIGLMLAGYYLVYLASPQDLGWHLDNSLVRLLLQLWPLTILTWGLAIPSFDGSAAGSPRLARWVASRPAFLVANVVIGICVIGVLSMQRGANELAVGRVGGSQITVALDEGWFPIEKHGRDEWSWSGGRARLRVNVRGDSARAVTLRFSIGSAGARTVTIRAGARELWSGAIRDQHVPVTIAGLTLPPGATAIEFTTDAAPVNEAPAAGGRALAFAIFNLRME